MLLKSLAILIIIAEISLSITIRADDQYENVDCSKCSCKNQTDSVTLNCDNKGLEHILSNWPTEEKRIIATFANNKIETLGTLPGTDAVVEVVFSNCGMKKLNPSAFQSVKNIQFLDLSYNFLTYEEITSENFCGPTSPENVIEPLALEHLNLAYNQIHSLEKGTFEHLPKLRRLNLEGNSLNVIDLHTQLALQSIKSLDTLNLANNQLTELVADAIKGLQLIEIDLSKNQLDFVPSDLDEVGASLEKLNLDDNPIIEITSKSFLGLHNLIDLSINNLTNVTYYPANTFSTLFKLKKLSASNNPQLTGIERQAFGPNQTLEEIYLNNNSLKLLDATLLTNWSALKVFEIKYNPIKCNCDLCNITAQLSNDITKDQDGPHCIHPLTGRAQPIYYLKLYICELDEFADQPLHRVLTHRFNTLRIILISLSGIMIFALLMAFVLGFRRFMHARRNYPFASDVLYNPLNSPRF